MIICLQSQRNSPIIPGSGNNNCHDNAGQYCTVSGPDPRMMCVFPFKWKGVTYEECTREGNIHI